jgi:hypothetical protein
MLTLSRSPWPVGVLEHAQGLSFSPIFDVDEALIADLI